MRQVSRSVPAPADLGLDVIGVPEGATVELELRIESVMEGVLVTGTAVAPLKGECVRCLEPVERELDADFQEMYSYPGADDRGIRAAAADAEDGVEEAEASVLDGDQFDLEPLLRDAVVLALPMQPVCRDDCPGLCPDCGARLADDPVHHHETVDIRWAALQGVADSLGDGRTDDDSGAGTDGANENREK